MSFCLFLPFDPPNNTKNKNLEKKHLEITFYTCVPQMTIIWCMVYGSWDIKCNRQNFLSFWAIFCPFAPLTTHKIKLLKKWKKHSGDIIILHMSTINKNHLPLNKPKNQNFEKMKKPLEISYFSQVYHEWCSWDMACDRCNCYFPFWAIFCPFTSLLSTSNSPKN